METNKNIGSTNSMNSKALNNGGPDPIQGYDVGVWVEDIGRGHKGVLLGQFTSVLITVKNASEPYMPVGSRQPIYLDGEIQIQWTLEKGLLDVNVFRETFGFKTYQWTNRYIRSPRFKITFAIDPVDFNAMDEACYMFGQKIERTPSGRFVLDMCKVDDWSLGSEAGKRVVANQWKGVAQQIWVEPLTLNNMAPNKAASYGANGQPTDPIEKPTFFYHDYADYASTAPRKTPDSYALYPSWLTQEAILRAEREVLNNLPDFPGKQAAYDAIDRLLGTLTSSNSSATGYTGVIHVDSQSASLNQVTSVEGLRLALTIERNEGLKLAQSTDPIVQSIGLAVTNAALSALAAMESPTSNRINNPTGTNSVTLGVVGKNSFETGGVATHDATPSIHTPDAKSTQNNSSSVSHDSIVTPGTHVAEGAPKPASKHIGANTDPPAKTPHLNTHPPKIVTEGPPKPISRHTP